MISLHEKVLVRIFQEFEKWSEESLACKKGCAICCTQNVVVTAVEGDWILRYIRDHGKEEWFASKFQLKADTRRPQVTTNGFAASCLQGEDVTPESYGNTGVCPFLEENCCSIYKVRPFSCRCFVSSSVCKPDTPALIAEYYLSASTAVMQIIEHLGQGKFIGNMLDVLLALCGTSENRKNFRMLPASMSEQGLANVVKALPLPGFLLLEEEMDKIGPLLQAIFSYEIEGKSIENILNNV